MGFDYDKLKKLSTHELHRLWENATRLAPKQESARQLCELIESSGLNYLPSKSNSVSLDDAIGKGMRAIIFSNEGETAALAAHGRGLPPLAGVDPLLQIALRGNYGAHNEATIQAGYLVTRLMENHGYIKKGSAALPSGCVAKSGAMFVRASSGQK